MRWRWRKCHGVEVSQATEADFARGGKSVPLSIEINFHYTVTARVSCLNIFTPFFCTFPHGMWNLFVQVKTSEDVELRLGLMHSCADCVHMFRFNFVLKQQSLLWTLPQAHEMKLATNEKKDLRARRVKRLVLAYSPKEKLSLLDIGMGMMLWLFVGRQYFQLVHAKRITNSHSFDANLRDLWLGADLLRLDYRISRQRTCMTIIASRAKYKSVRRTAEANRLSDRVDLPSAQ